MDPEVFICLKDGAPHTYRFPWKNFSHLLRHQAARRPGTPALVFRDVDSGARSVISYSELEARTSALARRLHGEYGICPGDRVAMALPNCPEIPLLTLALYRLGAASVPLDLRRDVPDRKRYKLQNSEARLLCVLPEHLDSHRDLVPEIPVVNTDHLLAAGGPAEGADLEPDWNGDPEEAQATTVVLYTSGTTGHPKGVLLTRRSITSNADGIIRWLAFDDHERLSLLLPMHHINSTVFSLTMFMVGGTLILNSRYSVSNFWPVIAEERVTSTSIVPTIMQDLLARSDDFSRGGYDISSLRKIMIGSAPVPAGAACRFYERFGLRLVQGYGSTEVSLRVTGVPVDLPEPDYRDILARNAIGVELANNNVRIDSDPPEGELGEILVRGPVMARGYLDEPKATTEVYRSGWFYTGDIGYWHRIGGRIYYFVHGRKKEIIIKGGVNISPVAVEDALLQAQPELAAAYVVGTENARWGEDVCAVVILRDSPRPEEQMAAAERIVEVGQAGEIPGINPFEAPCRVIPVVRDRLPMTSTGKVQRSVLRDIVRGMVQRGDLHGLEP